MPAAKQPAKTKADPGETVVSYKGFDADFKCRGFQYEVGKTYEHDGDVAACESGFHACEHPLHVLRYYQASKSRFARVTQSGKLARHGEDTKIASARITIDAELKLPEIVAAAVKWVFDRAKWSEGPVAAGKNEGVTASGYSGAATASGNYGAATASGDSGAATASGYSGAATASGNSGAATASGDSGAATASGYYGRVKGSAGCALFLTERASNMKIVAVWAGIAGQDGIKANTWYSLKNGKPVEVK